MSAEAIPRSTGKTGRKGPQGPPRRPAIVKRKRREAVYGVLLILPALILVAGVILIPIIYLVQTSLTNAHAYLPQRDFVGMDNYAQLFSAMSQFWPSLRVTLLYAALTLLLQMVVGVLVALVLHEKYPGRSFIRVVAIIPYMIPAVAVALVWRWLLDPNYGAWSHWLNLFTDNRVNFLSPATLFASLVVVSVWMFSPFVTISVLARLQTIDLSSIEAAHMDGAGPVRTFFYIRLPEIMPVLLMLGLLRFMFMFTKFDIIYLFAGTGQNVRTLPVYTFQIIFGEARLGLGSAAAVVLSVILIAVVTLYLGILERAKRV